MAPPPQEATRPNDDWSMNLPPCGAPVHHGEPDRTNQEAQSAQPASKLPWGRGSPLPAAQNGRCEATGGRESMALSTRHQEREFGELSIASIRPHERASEWSSKAGRPGKAVCLPLVATEFEGKEHSPSEQRAAGGEQCADQRKREEGEEGEGHGERGGPLAQLVVEVVVHDMSELMGEEGAPLTFGEGDHRAGGEE